MTLWVISCSWLKFAVFEYCRSESGEMDPAKDLGFNDLLT